MRALRIVIILILASALSSCAYLFDSPFPAYLTHAVDQVDITDLIPYVAGGHYEARAINSPTGEYVWLMAEGPTFSRRFVLFDDDLDVVLESAETDRDKFDSGALLMFGNSGLLFCGTLTYDTTFSKLADDSWGNTGVRYGYWDPAGATHRFLEIPSGTDTTQCQQSSDYSTALTAGPGMNSMSNSAYSYDGVEAVAQDWKSGRVAMYAIPDSDDQVHGVVADATDFVTSLGNPIIGGAGSFIIPLDGEFHERPQFAGDGTIVFTEDNGRDRMVFYDLNGDEVDTYVANNDGETQYAYSPAGKYWYIMDAQAGILVKARTWW